MAVNITAVAPTSSTFIEPYPTGADRPTAGAMNVAVGATIAQLQIVQVGAGHQIRIYNSLEKATEAPVCSAAR